MFYHFLGTVGIVPGTPVVLSAKEFIELVESTDIPIIDRKHASDGNDKSNSEDIPGKCYVVPISFSTPILFNRCFIISLVQ